MGFLQVVCDAGTAPVDSLAEVAPTERKG